MRFPSRLLCSRHGVHYLRLVIPKCLREAFGGRREFRYSLRTKDASEARFMARLVNAKIDTALFNLKGETMAGRPKVRIDELGLKITDDLRTYTVKYPSGLEIKVEDSEDDHRRAKEFAELYARSLPPTPIPAPVATERHAQDFVNQSIRQTMKNFMVEPGDEIGEKTLYEYGKYVERFAEWVDGRKGRKDSPIHEVGKLEVSEFIRHLKTDRKVAGITIDSKYRPALTNLFRQAQGDGAYPAGDLPTKGKRQVNRRALKDKRKRNREDKPYTVEELSLIFHPNNLTTAKKPHEFWLPLLALFTGARLNEICQMELSDIRPVGTAKVWAFDINDRGDKSTKTSASRRLVPIAKQLVQIGLMDYLKDVKATSGATRLFPYLNADLWGRYTHDPTRDWKRYREWIGVRHTEKDSERKNGGFHPFRYNFINALKDADVPEEDRKQLVGHDGDGEVHSDYAKERRLKELSEKAMSRLRFDGVDLSKLRYEDVRERLREALTKLTTKRIKHDRAKEARAKHDSNQSKPKGKRALGKAQSDKMG